ncbi:MAG: hypothetical protein WD794_05660 [Mycobacteriales bacterium]
MPSRSGSRTGPVPLETDDVKLVAVGTTLWALGLLVLVVLRLTGAAEVRTWWMGMCGYGIALGLYGIHYCRRRRDARTRPAAGG